jgi:hypothetical protein
MWHLANKNTSDIIVLPIINEEGDILCQGFLNQPEQGAAKNGFSYSLMIVLN